MPDDDSDFLNRLADALVPIEKASYPGAHVYAEMPESVELVAILNWIGEGSLVPPADVISKYRHTISPMILFSRAEQPQSDRDARAAYSIIRKAVAKDQTIGGVCQNSRVTGWREGYVSYAGNQYIGLTIHVTADELVPLGS
jgi:hypothetical protein